MKVFCWDFDGTLAYSNHLWSRSVFDALNEVFPHVDDDLYDQIRSFMQSGFPWHTPDVDYSFCKGELWWEFMEKHFFDIYLKCGIVSDISEKAAKTVRLMIKEKSRYTLYDDTANTLQKLKENGAVNVLLSNNYPDLGEILEQLSLSQYFDEVILSAVVGYNKPHKKLFDLAKAKYPNAEFYMIGDNINADIFGGKQNGMKTVLVHKGYSEYADYCFDELKSVLKLI